MKEYFFTNLEFCKLPFEITTKDIIYVESDYHEEFNRFIQLYYQDICDDFKSKGYNFIYFPRLSEERTIEIIKHLYPDYGKLPLETISLKSNFMLEFLNGDTKQYFFGPTFLYTKIPPFGGDEDEYQTDFWLDAFSTNDLESCYFDGNLSSILYVIDDDIKNWEENEERMMEEDAYYYGDFIDVEEDKDILESESEIRKIAKDAKKKKKSLIEDINIKISELNQQDKDSSLIRYYLRREVVPVLRISDIHVTNRCQILLPEYGLEMKLSAQYKAFYILYLNHPEGIDHQLIGMDKDCRAELEQWYDWCNTRNQGTSDLDDVFDPKNKNSQPVVAIISRIKAEIAANLGGKLANIYCIAKDKKDGKYRINSNCFRVSIDKKNPFWKDLSPEKQPSFE